MRITALTDDVATEGFEAEHGLSLYIETDSAEIMFDFGASGVFTRNAARAGVDVRGADVAVLSHDHYDHGGGLRDFFACNAHAKVYAAREIFGKRYSLGGTKYAGLEAGLAKEFRDRFVYVDETVCLNGNAEIVSLGRDDMPYPDSGEGLCTLTAAGLVRDDFAHERYLLIREGGKRILVSGCSHKGILNIVYKFRPDVMIGGFHLKGEDEKKDGRESVLAIAEALSASGAEFYTGHCTGIRAYGIMKEILGSRLTYLAAGDTIII